MAVNSQISTVAPNSNPSTVVLARAQSNQIVNVAVNNTSNAKSNNISIDLSGINSSQTADNLALNNASNTKTNSAISSNILKKIVESLNNLSDNLDIGTKFEAFEKMKGVYYIRTYNTKTNETISEFPPTQYLNMIANFINGTGNLVDRKV
ncbi:flagellar protein FlaG [Thermodesulfobium sp. 4217-1]|uniref:flagellar protein FlaG n=1 Tax=Thermodesulfobium sp. 4217-1 TaxID=3120013 RepID=UPI0032215E8C